MVALVTRQPYKGIYTIAFIAVCMVRLPILSMFYLLKRPHPQWTYQQAIGRFIFKCLWGWMSKVRFRTTKTLKPGADGERFIKIKAAPAEMFEGLLKDTRVKPESIGGMWYPRLFDPSRDKDGNVVLHFHGGAFVLGGVRPLEGGYIPEQVAKHLDGLALLPQYRMAWQDKSHFPAQIQDSVTAYAQLLSLGVPASNIIFSGDSAGGNIALTLLRYLSEHPVLPLPKAVWLWCPWLDLTPDAATVMANRNARWDWIEGELLAWGREAYIPESMVTTHPYLSPLGNEFVTKIPIFLQTADLDVLYDSHVQYVEAMKKIRNKIKLHNIKYGVHDAFAITQILGTVKEGELAAASAIEFTVR